MIYELTTTREGKGYQHILCVSNDHSIDKVMSWDKKHRGANAGMINDYANLNETQLSKIRELEKVISRLELKR